METPPEETNAQQKPTQFKVARILAAGTVVSALLAKAVPPIVLITALLAMATVLSVLVTAVTKLRFSLRTMILVMLWIGGCATLLTKIEEPGLFAIGILGTLVFIAFVISSIARANIPAERLDK